MGKAGDVVTGEHHWLAPQEDRSLVAPSAVIRCMAVELTEALLSQAAGWDVIKLARAYLGQGQVLSSQWAPPLLRGMVQSGETSFRASMVINNSIDIENLCTCREAREWGKICAHGLAVGLHWLQAQKAGAAPAPARSPAATS